MNKKVKTIIIIIGLFLIVYFLQINFFSWFTIRGIQPNLFVILVLFIGLFAGKKLGGISGLIIGIILDFLIGKSVGYTGLFLGIVGLLGEYFDKNFSKESRLAIILMSGGSTILYEIGMYVVNILKYSVEIEIIPFLIILTVETIFNILIVMILYPGIRKLGYYIESIYKGNKILTRYF